MKLYLFIIVLCSLIAWISCTAVESKVTAVESKVSYKGYQLMKVELSDEAKVKAFLKFAEESKDKVVVLSDKFYTHTPINFLIHKDLTANFKQLISESQFHVELVINDFQKVLDKEEESVKSRTVFTYPGDPSQFTLNQYHRHDEINAYLKALNQKYPSITSLHTVGYSFEGRQMLGIKVGKPAANKQVYWIDAGIHAREWIAPATSLVILSQLVTKYTTDPTIKTLVDTLDWYILPSANPDGYEYTWTGNRLWRKTRSTFPTSCNWSGCCVGTDPNRNWDFQFGGAGTSSNPCSNIYKGPYAFSEPECAAMSNMMLKLAANNNMKAMITLHSAAQLWLVPYGYATNAYPPTYNNLFAAAVAAEAAERRVHNVKYTVEHSAGLYPAAGASDDWSLGVANATYVYTIELRDSAGDFVLPADQIIPTGEEVFEGVKVIANRIINGS